MGTVPLDSALGAEPAVALHPEEEEAEEDQFRATPSAGIVAEDSLEEERTGPLLEEEEEEDGSEGRGVRTGPAADDPSGAAEEEPSSTLPVWHPGGGLGEPRVGSGDSLAPSRLSAATEGACGGAGLAALAGREEEEEEGEGARRSGGRPELPLAEELGGMEQACLLGTRAPGAGSGAHGTLRQSCCTQAGGEEQECPICTELYDQDRRKPALLNCSHTLCGQCLQAILEAASAADIGRVRCPICRQKTPMMEWEICRLQEELLLLGSAQGPASVPAAFSPLPPRQPGFWGGLEHRFRVRFRTSRVMGFFPCLRYPACLIDGLARLERHHCRCYRAALLALAAAEMLSLLLVFLPIILLLLLFLILDK